MERATLDAPPGIIRPLRPELAAAFGRALSMAEMHVSAGNVEELVRVGFIHGYEEHSSGRKPQTCAEAAAMTAPEFKIGDVVRLKSGGHLMTVVSVGCGDLGLAWSCDGKFEENDLPRGALHVLSAEELREYEQRRALDLEIPF